MRPISCTVNACIAKREVETIRMRDSAALTQPYALPSARRLLQGGLRQRDVRGLASPGGCLSSTAVLS